MYLKKDLATRRTWLNKNGNKRYKEHSAKVTLTGQERKTLWKWFCYWDRDCSATINAAHILQTLKNLRVLTAEQCEALSEEAKNLLAKQAAKHELNKVESRTSATLTSLNHPTLFSMYDDAR